MPFELYIDNVRADTDAATTVSITLTLAAVTDPERARTGFTRTVEIPMTACNRALMGDCDQVHGAVRFNDRLRQARVEAGGATLIEGDVCLTSCRRDASGAGWYRLHIVGAGRRWAAHASSHKFSDLAVDWTCTLGQQAIAESWTGATPVRFFPVWRSGEGIPTGQVSVYPPSRILSTDDYHPFLHVRTVVGQIFREAGYEVASEFMASPFFDALYMSGRYPEHDTSLLRAKMDFRAARFAPATAAADRLGRVFANPYASLNTIGNLVDTADPTELSPAGTVLDDVYSRGGCFRKDGGRIVFVPVQEVAVGFEYDLSFASDYRILSRVELAGFNTLCLDESVTRSFRIVNHFADRRGALATGRSYRVLVFNHVAGRSYQLRGRVVLASGIATMVTMVSFSTRSELFTSPAGASIRDEALWSRDASTAEWAPCVEDWAVYDGFVNETGRTDVSLTVRSAPQRLSPSSPKYFDTIWFRHPDAGASFTLHRAVVRPVFASGPGEGSALTFSDVAAHDMSRLGFMQALRQLFDLCFYPDERTRTVRIEPREVFYGNPATVDWCGRIDASGSCAVEELGEGMYSTVTFRYAPGDAAATRWDSTHGDVLGRWSVAVTHAFALPGEQLRADPLFTPTLSRRDCFPDAPAAWLMQAAPTNAASTELELNFPAKIVLWAGMVPLPADQRWGWPTYGTSYPLAAFLYPGPDAAGPVPAASVPGPGSDARVSLDTIFRKAPSADAPFGLCFEDRGGIPGLHRFWDGYFDLCNRGRRLQVGLRLSPDDVERLLCPGDDGADFRARYLLSIDGETFACRLEELTDYDPAAPAARCTFLTMG